MKAGDAFAVLEAGAVRLRVAHDRGGVREQNLVWKDTVLVHTGETVELLLDVTNHGIWDGALPHC